MKSLIAVFFTMLSFVVLGQEVAPAPVAEVDKFAKFMSEAGIYVTLLVMVVEYLIGVSKLKSNSTIEAIINMAKMIFIKK